MPYFKRPTTSMVQAPTTSLVGAPTTSYVPLPTTSYQPLNSQDLLGSILFDMWDSRYGVSIVGGAVDSWTGMKAGLVCSAAAAGNRPTYTAANAALNDMPTVNSVVVGTKALRMAADHGSDICAASSRPYTFWIGTMNTFAGLQQVFSLDNAGWTVPRYNLRTSGTAVDFVVNDDGALIASYATTGTTAHFWETVIESDNQLVLYRDGAEVARDATGATIDAAIRRVSIGQYPGAIRPADASHAYMGICTSAPSAAQRASLLQYSRDVYGTP